jgi:hypothetical protein
VERILVCKEHPALVGGSSFLVVGKRLAVRRSMQMEENSVCCVQFGAVIREATVGHRTVLEWVQPEEETDTHLETSESRNLASDNTVAKTTSK